MNPIVYFDLETAGLKHHHAITQLAAIAIDGNGDEVASFNQYIQFDPKLADPEALKIQNYSPEKWAHAISDLEARRQFAEFLRPFMFIPMVSKRGRAYKVARLGGFNAARFDGPKLLHWFKTGDVFLPAHPMMLDVMQLVLWWAHENPTHKLENFRLESVAPYFDIQHEQAHDALCDVRATAQIGELMKHYMRDRDAVA